MKSLTEEGPEDSRPAFQTSDSRSTHMKAVNNHRGTAQSGFTIVETIFASVILMVGLLTVAQLFILAGLYNRHSKQDTLATVLAHRKIEQLLAVPLDDALIAYGGSLGNSSRTAGYFENFYIDPATKQVSTTAWTAGQAPDYVVTWVVQPDSQSPAMSGLRVLTVRAEATRAAMIGNGVDSTKVLTETAEMSTIRTPSQ